MSWVIRVLKGRFWGFGLVGLSVLAGGTALLYVLVHFLGVQQNVAYFIQAVVSIEANFVLNRFFNWRDRRGPILTQWLKFHTTKVGTIILNQILFALLTYAGIFYLVATVICTAVITVINFITNDKYVFASRRDETQEIEWATQELLASHPLRVAVVIPVRNSTRTITRCVQSLLRQDYPLLHIFLVANVQHEDKTWEALASLRDDPRVSYIQVELPQYWMGRDASIKRYYGCLAAMEAGCDVIALTDSQVVTRKNWISTALYLLEKKHVDGVAGVSLRPPRDKSFVGVYQDGSLFSEWPHYGEALYLTKHSFGRARGLPITANLFMSVRAFERINPRWPVQCPYGWEDFHLAWTIVSSGLTLLCTDQLAVYRLHRRKFRLAKHFSAGIAALDFHRKYPESGYSKRMLMKALLVVFCGLTVTAALAVTLALHADLFFLGICIMMGLAFFLLGLFSIRSAQDWRGILFPFLDIIHIGFWISGAIYAFLRGGKVDPKVARLLIRLR
ncbi:MAG TPA: GtrA family protein [Ktedonobacterales bacterium]|nr:GtrA family protein [Ktedonobacterales bacterium]